ncbi:MAG: Glycosyl transferase group 1 [Candidatus Gallionella acididurans]|uniref:Glycosyl transferase group 1 n=1 Tax=Candidatus Gallionella acididurans TaxID=1796491 RepID=A0A139BSX1_9PROT|nr:MAG: Glycosyl transferase group 1 [Candidatus Gallionella acididurans]
MSKNICTIIAKNYISFARTLCSSFLEHHPDGKCYVLIIDEFEGYIDASEENFEIIRIDELGIPRLPEFCFKYNVTELATATKPYLLKYLFASVNMDNILYLDPDILVTHSLDKLYEALEKTDIILTPHLDRDYPDDGLLPNDGHIMLSGIYNLGFIGVRKCENVNNFLVWWQHKLYDKCVVDHSAGYFVDQKFIDLAMVLFREITVIYDTGYNVAYWNIHSRNIRKENDIWMCNNDLLYFYHFSNYKPEKNVLSGHQNRFSLENLPALHELFLVYTELLQLNGYDVSAKQWPYGYGKYSNRKTIHEIERINFRKIVPSGTVVNPFNLESHPVYLRKAIFKAKIWRKARSLIYNLMVKIKPNK